MPTFPRQASLATRVPTRPSSLWEALVIAGMLAALAAIVAPQFGRADATSHPDAARAGPAQPGRPRAEFTGTGDERESTDTGDRTTP